MLVLHQKPGQSIYLTGGIVVTLLPGDRLGIEAPRDVRIVREELVPDANGITPQQLGELWIDYGQPVG